MSAPNSSARYACWALLTAAAGVTSLETEAGAKRQTESRSGPARELRRVCRVTAYCDRGITASGTRVGVGQCAAPADIPFGTRLYIPELGRSFVVTDRTHPRFRSNTVDIFMPSKSTCLKFGRRYLRCEFAVPPSGETRLARAG